MNATTLATPDAASIINEGWKALIDRLGFQKATQFILLLERGKGDTVEEIARYWGNMNIEDIYQRIQDWKIKKNQ